MFCYTLTRRNWGTEWLVGKSELAQGRTVLRYWGNTDVQCLTHGIGFRNGNDYFYYYSLWFFFFYYSHCYSSVSIYDDNMVFSRQNLHLSHSHHMVALSLSFAQQWMTKTMTEKYYFFFPNTGKLTNIFGFTLNIFKTQIKGVSFFFVITLFTRINKL